MINTSMRNILQGLLGLSLFLSASAPAATLNYHFWPGAITQDDPDSTGSLYAWPDYQVLLQNKSAQGIYSPAVISDSVATELTAIFKVPSASPVIAVRDPVSRSWGLSIPGGSTLHANNQQLVEPMLLGFVNCLSTLSIDELDRMKEVIYTPNSSLDPATGAARFDEEQKRVAGKLYENYRTNRCEGGPTAVPDLVKKTSRRYLLSLLTGQKDPQVTDAALLVVTTLYKDLLFASKGLWVRVTLGELQKFIGEILARYPAPVNTDWIDRDYSSFVDFVLLTREKSGLTKEQYLKVASACGLDDVADIFASFPLKQCSSKGLIHLLQVYLNTTEAVFLIPGGRS